MLMGGGRFDDLNVVICPEPGKKQVEFTDATAMKRKIEATEEWEGAQMDKVCWKKQRLELIDSRQ